jgi:hypothetical protein
MAWAGKVKAENLNEEKSDEENDRRPEMCEAG